MKRFKKMIALVVVCVLTLTMSSMFAFATITSSDLSSPGSITITSTETGRSYQVYKIFDLTGKQILDDKDTVDTSDDETTYAVSYTIDSAWVSFFIGASAPGSNYLVEKTASNASNFSGCNELTYNGKTYFMNITETNKADFAAAAQDYAGKTTGVSPVTTVTENDVEDNTTTPSVDESITEVVSVGSLGYYMIVPKGASDIADGQVSIVSLTSTVPNATVQPKGVYPDVDKTIVDADDTSSNKGTAVNVGDYIQFKLEGTVPDTTGFTTYDYLITDTLSSGLTFITPDTTHPMTVKIEAVAEDTTNNISAKPELTLTTTSADSTAYYIMTHPVDSNTQKVTIDIKNMTKIQDYVGKKITITYYARLNNGALTTDHENNSVTLTYSNNPKDSTDKTTTPPKVTYVFDFDINLDKVDKANSSTKLDNATFALYRMNGNTKEYYYQDSTSKVVSWISALTKNGSAVTSAADADNITKVTTSGGGKATFPGVDSGTYYLEETVAPDGYNLLTDPVTVVITATYDTTANDGKLTGATIKVGDSDAVAMTTTESGNETQYTGPTTTIKSQVHGTAQIENATGSILPSTGGIGTTLFYLIGAILMIGAGVILVTRRRVEGKQ